ncbi:MAG: hypothetical protein ACP5E3_10855 [Bacteroidales bacterium]
MKTLIYISGISGIVLIVLRIIGIYSPVFESNVILYTGLALLVFIFIPLLIFENHKQKKKIDEIINNHKPKVNQGELSKNKIKTGKGWSMNNSPFRERRSGLNWGGGNIHAAGAKRGSRRSFLN